VFQFETLSETSGVSFVFIKIAKGLDLKGFFSRLPFP
jgi:hypothetical protein